MGILIDESTVEAKLREAFCEALGLDEDEIELDASVIDDLGAESLDFLDIAFRLERAFGIKIPRGEIQRSAEEAAGAQFEADGKLTDAGAVALREALPEVDPSRIRGGMPVRDIPRLFTVRTFLNLVLKLLQEKEAAA
jgi:acyl carrier protein